MWYTNIAGEWVEPGTLRKTRTTDFDGGALPSWLTLGTGSVAASTTAPGGVLLTSAVGVGQLGTLLGPSIDLSTVEAARVRLSLTPNAGAAMYLGFHGATSAAYINASHGGQMQLAVRHSSGAITLQPVGELFTHGKRHHLSVLVTPSDLTLYVGEGDEIWGHHTFASGEFTAGVVTPYIRVTGNASVAGSADVHQLAYDLWWL